MCAVESLLNLIELVFKAQKIVDVEPEVWFGDQLMFDLRGFVFLERMMLDTATQQRIRRHDAAIFERFDASFPIEVSGSLAHSISPLTPQHSVDAHRLPTGNRTQWRVEYLPLMSESVRPQRGNGSVCKK